MSTMYTSLLRAGNVIDWSSRYRATFGNGAVVDCDWLPEPPELKPRMKILPPPGPLALDVTFGVYFMRSSKVVTFSALSCSAVAAWMVIGAFSVDSLRRWAVTVTAAIALESVAVASA